MFVYVSDRWLGRVDRVAGVCCVKTEFVCAFGFPMLPRRSALVPSGAPRHSWVPIPLSARSVLMAYLRAGCIVAGLFLGLCAYGLMHLWIEEATRPMRHESLRSTVPWTGYAFTSVIALMPWLMLVASYVLSWASAARRRKLARIPGVSPELTRKLCADSAVAIHTG